MNFYKHHLGDYSAATAHLTWNEDCAYRRLLDAYYKREQPIPSDVGAACRLVRATTASEKKAVAAVLEEFFYLGHDGWHNRRCDAEIAAASQQAETNRRIAQDREANRRARVAHESTTNRSRPQPSAVHLSRLQTPDSTSHTHTSPPRDAVEPTGISEQVSVCFDVLTKEKQEVVRGVVDALNQAQVAGADLNHPRLLVQVLKGASAEQYRQAAHDAGRKRKGLEYVLGIVRNQLEAAESDARELPNAPRPAPPVASTPSPPPLTPEQLQLNKERAAAALALAKKTLTGSPHRPTTSAPI